MKNLPQGLAKEGIREAFSNKHTISITALFNSDGLVVDQTSASTYALVQGKSTSYYGATDPFTEIDEAENPKYSLKEGDC
jgi:hypothetical protein